MRLLFCIKAMNNPGGGAERVLADVANGLSRRGHDVALLSFERPGGRSFYPLDPAIERLELRIGSTTKSATPGETFRRLPALRRAVRQHRPDVTIGFMHSMYIPLALALAGTGIPLVASEHTPPENYRRRRLEFGLLRAVAPLLSGVTAVSEHARAQYPQALRRKMVVVPNPLAVSATRRADVSTSLGRRNVLLTVGRLVAQKDHATLIEAFGRIVDAVPDWDLRIVGDGELHDDLAARIARLRLEQRVALVPSVAAINREYAAAQLFVMPSRHESLGLVTAEALAHGLPVVGFADCPGTNELVQDGIDGALVDPGDDRAVALAAGLLGLMTDDAGRRRLAAAARIVPGFEIESVLVRWESLLARAATSGSQGRK